MDMKINKSDYYDLQTELLKTYSRKRNFWIFLGIGIIFGAIVPVTNYNNLNVNTVITTLFIVFFVFLILWLLHLIWVNMNQSDYEEKMVGRGIKYLSRNQLSSKRIGIIRKRAEIGSNALSSRTMLPVLAIPLLITYFSGKISPETQLILIITMIIIGLSYTVELDKANMDIFIRQICVSYIPPEAKKKKKG